MQAVWLSIQRNHPLDFIRPFLAMTMPEQAHHCSSGLTKTLDFILRFLAMAMTEQAHHCSSGLTKTFAYERLFLWRLMHRGCHHSSDVSPLASSYTGKTYDFNTEDKLNTLLLNCLLSTRQLKISVPAKWIRTSRQYVLNIYSCNNAYADLQKFKAIPHEDSEVKTTANGSKS